MEQIPCDNNGLGSSRDHTIYSSAKGLSNVGLALVDTARSLPVILPDSEVGI